MTYLSTMHDTQLVYRSLLTAFENDKRRRIHGLRAWIADARLKKLPCLAALQAELTTLERLEIVPLEDMVRVRG